jgi:cysteine-rich repeat protein
MGGTQTGGTQTGGTVMGGTPMGGSQTGGTLMGGTTMGGTQTGGTQTMGTPHPNLGAGLCEESILLTCDSGTQRFNTDFGQAGVDTYLCGDNFNYPGKDLFFEFQHDNPVQVEITAARMGSSFTVSYLFFALNSQGQCERSEAPCIEVQDNTTQPSTLLLDYRDSPILLSYDPRVTEGSTEVDITVNCIIPECGDGVLEGAETCDDENNTDGDGCSASCQVEEGAECEGEPSVCNFEICGDGVVVGREECDDAGTMDGDGCSSTCKIEMGSVCIGEPSVCSAALGQTCADAVAIEEPGITEGSTSGFEDTYTTYSGGCGNSDMVSGPDRVYRIAVPPHQILQASLESMDEQYQYPKLWLASECPDLSNSCQQKAAEELLWHNGSDDARIVYLVVDGWYPENEGVFRLHTAFLPADDVVGATCDAPIVIDGSGTYMGDITNRSNVYGGHGGACERQGGFWGYSMGADEVYAVEVGPGETLEANAMPDGWDHVISIQDSCADTQLSCVSWTDLGSVQVQNTTGQAQTYYIIVAGFFGYDRGTYSLSVSIR